VQTDTKQGEKKQQIKQKDAKIVWIFWKLKLLSNAEKE
jgi:hypothetical protein